MPATSREVSPRSILVLRFGAVGDVVRTLPAVRLLRRTWPEAKIVWAVEPGPGSLLRGCPDIDDFVVLPRREISRSLSHFNPRGLVLAGRFVRELRARRPDLALDFQSSFKSGSAMYLSGAAERWGFRRRDAREGAHWFANHRFALPAASRHRVERAVALARAAGAEDGPREADLGLTREEREKGLAVVERLAGARAAVALAPFSSARQSWKRFPKERWADVAAGLAAAGHAVLIIGGPGEESEARRLCERAGAGVAFTGALPLRGLAAALAACDLFVGGDTGPMHIAWAVGLPVVAVYGPTDPSLNAPYGEGHVVLAPPKPSRRHDADPFPGITAELILSSALEQLRGRALLARRRTTN